ncbi:hypothetical protein F5884DRAFT_786537 [Xylogone sp. PMI_703]|nr:hypothetical protein F5884DRAFT_786537 [Xylogone sp. PMI_703]
MQNVDGAACSGGTPATPVLTHPPSQPLKPQRVLACVLCQRRKIKCDRKYPCANCIKSRAECEPASQVARRRRRRLPERELLDRLRQYEDLLRQNNIRFEPLHKDHVEKKSVNVDDGDDLDDERPKSSGADSSSQSITINLEKVYEAKNIWHSIKEEYRDIDSYSDSSDDEVRDVVVRRAWDQLFETDDHLLFGSRKTAINISTLHPEPVQIFRLWQLYLENVDPLLKVTHTPSLQGRIIEAAGNISSITPTLEALMFSIYCMAILSLSVDDCQAIFGLSKIDLLTKYQFGCQQALSNCGFLRTSDRECLTALYLYLMSVRPCTVPQSLSSMMGVAVRIAQRMGIHSEVALAKCTPLEAEMRRRLWWSLILFDARVGEMASSKTATLTPTWDCKIPLNVNDSDLRPEMKEPPQVQGKFTEALFVVVRSELGDFVRQTMFHVGFTNPALKSVAKDIWTEVIPEGSELISLEKLIEEKYLRFCDPENPVHFMATLMSRSYIAKCRLMEYNFRYSKSSQEQAEIQGDPALSYAFSMIQCDTKLMTSPITKGFLWVIQFYFPFVAYVYIVQSLKRQPDGDHAEKAWEIMSDNYETRFGVPHSEDNPFFKIFTKIILQAWEVRESTFKQLGKPLVIPRIVSSIKHKMAQITQNPEDVNAGYRNGGTATVNDFPPMPVGVSSHNMPGIMGGQSDYYTIAAEAYPDLGNLVSFDFDVNQLDWSAMDWDMINTPAGAGFGEPNTSSLQY